jgi:hypothetical protein
MSWWAWVDLNHRPSRFTSSGRSSHLLDPAMTRHFLDLAFALSNLRTSLELFAMKEFPGTAVLDRECAVVVVLENALGEIFGMADVKAAGGLAAENVRVERHSFLEWWAWVDLNHRPRPYQGRALAT